MKPGELIVYEDAYRTLAVAINRGDAAGTLRLEPDSECAAAAAMIGSPRAHLRLADSTNERAKLLAAAGAPHGTLVTADEQSAGHGRQGRAWSAPPGSAVLMSLAVRDPEPVLPLAAAVAVCEAVPARCEIKWPNDVWLERRKLAGSSSRAALRRVGRCSGSAPTSGPRSSPRSCAHRDVITAGRVRDHHGGRAPRPARCARPPARRPDRDRAGRVA